MPPAPESARCPPTRPALAQVPASARAPLGGLAFSRPNMAGAGRPGAPVGRALEGDWIDPDAGRVLFRDYSQAWIDERPGLRPNTVQVYRYVLGRHINPALGSQPVVEIKEPHVRRWRKELLDSGASIATAAKPYRLLKAILNTAVDDGLIHRNPCRIRGATQERSPERPVLTLRQVFALADAIHPRFRALILLAVFCSLRWGELAALRRADIDLGAGTVKITRSVTKLPGGGYSFGPPKSEAGYRTVVIPGIITDDLSWHMARFVGPDDDALIFTSSTGTPLHDGNFRNRIWRRACEQAGLSSIHFHDLRHTGNDLTAAAGANLRELMERMGHSSTRAALIYLHASSERQRALADTVSDRARSELRPTSRKRGRASSSGTEVARRRDSGP